VKKKIMVFMYLSFKFLHVTTKLESGLQQMLDKLCKVMHCVVVADVNTSTSDSSYIL